ncbi:MAG: hypothetical protein K8T90_17230 [Planctomycetes bacterium]|nr:hypothetical protein [Planctomycetota bacterium]
MHLATRMTLALALGLGLLTAVPATAAPYSAQFTSVHDALVSKATDETDPAKKAALTAAAALFDNTSKSFAADLTDAMNAITKLEKAYGTSDPAMTLYLDGLVQSAYLPVFFRGNQAYNGAALKLVNKGDYHAVAALAKSHAAKATALSKRFPEVANPSITRLQKMKALIAFEKYGFALAKRFKITLNQF